MSKIKGMFDKLSDVLMDCSKLVNKKITFINSVSDDYSYSYAEVYKQSLKVLGYLQNQGLKMGDKLIFQIDDNYQFVLTFWACILGGIIAVPVSCVDIKSWRRLQKLYYQLNDGYIIGNTEQIVKLNNILKESGITEEELHRVCINVDKALHFPSVGTVYEVKPSDTAMIQFSSGSTSEPKGIVLTQNNIAVNLEAIASALEINSADSILFWIPLTHDMGLIGAHLVPALCGMNQGIMNKGLFLSQPLVFLNKIEEYKITHIAMPNFGFGYIMNAITNHELDFNLSSIKCVMNGAEPISVNTCLGFMKRMSKYGLKENTLLPVYGMAEATLVISIPKINQPMTMSSIDRNMIQIGSEVSYLDYGSENAVTYVSEGRSINHIEIQIVNDKEKPVSENILGIIMIRGKSVFQRYYHTEADINENGWFSTGDLGFIREGNLYVVGRVKDILIIHGQNYLASDLEKIATDNKIAGIGEIAITAVYDSKQQQEKIGVFLIYHNANSEKTDEFALLQQSIKKLYFDKAGILVDYIIPVTELPKTDSGKIMRYKLKKDFEAEQFIPGPLGGKSDTQINKDYNPVKNIEEKLLSVCRDYIPDIDTNKAFMEEGVNSLLVTTLYTKINELYPDSIKIEDLFVLTNIHEVAFKIHSQGNKLNPKEMDIEKETSCESEKIAIVGMAAILPGAKNIYEYWENLCGGIESIGPIPVSRKKKNELFYERTGQIGNNSNDSKFFGYITGLEEFDHKFFKILPREAIAMSPGQRLFLETAYRAMEDGGYSPESLMSTSTGVYVGYISDLPTQDYQRIVKASDDIQTPTGGLSSNIAGRLSYYMDFSGPSVMVDTACSSSLSALHMACQGIINGDCEQAIVGGVQLNLLPYEKQDIGIESLNNKVRPFDVNADGTCEGEGVGAIFIKPYKKALRDRDYIYGNIIGSVMNQDGHSLGLSAPNPDAQNELIHNAIQQSKVDYEDISYIEAHGTGTNIGDPIEMNVLANIFPGSSYENPLFIGSVKANIGHLFAASGISSLIKCCLMLKYKKVPALINYHTLNDKIHIKNSRIKINTELIDWYTVTKLRRCAISNFGFSGTNVNVILEEELPVELPYSLEAFPVVVSAPTWSQLDLLVKEYIKFLQGISDSQLGNISFTSAVGRKHYPNRLAITAKNILELSDKLKCFSSRDVNNDNIFFGKTTKICELTEDSKEVMNTKVRAITKKILDNADQRNELVKQLAELYVRGADTCWETLYTQDGFHKVSIPGYIFEKKEIWPAFV